MFGVSRDGRRGARAGHQGDRARHQLRLPRPKRGLYPPHWPDLLDWGQAQFNARMALLREKRALQELEAGNAFAFATGKEARAKEREAAKAWREGRVADDDPEEVGGVVINVDEKFKHMQIGKTASAASLGGAAAKEAPKAGLADDAFGSDDDDDDGW